MSIEITRADRTTDPDVTAIAGLESTGIAVRSASDTWVSRTITGGTGLTITYGNGVSGNPLIELDADLVAWAAVNPSSYSTTAQIAAAYQPLDSDLTSWAAVTRASGFDTFAATPTSANLAALVTDETGSGSLVFATSPTLVTPTLGVATATSINKVALTAPATGSTLTIADGKTLTASNTITFTATDGSTLAIGAGGTLASAAYVATGTSGATVPLCNGVNTWAGGQTVGGNLVLSGASSPFLDVIDTTNNVRGFFQSDDDSVNIGAVSDHIVVFYQNNSAVGQIGTSDGLLWGNATGGDKGAGTINAVAVYDDNTLLTCYVLDAAIDGKIDMAKWDEKVPNRIIPAKKETVIDPDGQPDENGIYPYTLTDVEPERVEVRIHEDARKFAARLGTEYDPLDIDKYAAHWKTKRHLTSMPNEEKFDPAKGMPTGSWIQRLIETVEIQAVHIEALNQRLKVLEAAP